MFYNISYYKYITFFCSSPVEKLLKDGSKKSAKIFGDMDLPAVIYKIATS